MKNLILLTAMAGLAGCATTAQQSPATSQSAVVTNYADLAHAVFSDSLAAAQALDAATDLLITQPSAANLEAAKQAWLAARVPYQQSEVFRFGNAIVDDWEGQLNAWPLDEGLIDYVDSNAYEHELGNPGAQANLVANSSLQVAGEALDVSVLSPELLAGLNELAGSEANVATGYHAVEFLLWGQDLNGTNSGAGQRPWTDYASDHCSNGNCDRRAQYLDAATDLLVTDLEYMVAQWAANGSQNYRAELLLEDSEQGLRKMLFGMGSLSLGELAGERMKVALEANSVEDEHDCFSDNTHNSHYYNNLGVANIWFGQYQRIDGSQVSGASLQSLVAQNDATAAAEISAQFLATKAQVGTLVASAEEAGVHFDQLIATGNNAGNALVEQSIEALVAQTEQIERAAGVLGITALNPDTADHEF